MDNRTACPDLNDLQRLSRGLVGGLEAVALEAHFAECDACLATARSLSEADELTSALRAAASAPPSPPVDPLLLDRLFGIPAAVPTSAEGGPTVLLGEELFDPPRETGEVGRIGPYSVRRLLGEGGMGVVYLAWHLRLKRPVALKMLKAEAVGSRERLGRFRREAELLAQLRHPNIVQIHDIGEHSGRPYLAMEYLDGGSLAERLLDGPLPAREAAALVKTLAEAVHAAHAAGVVHRDLKPANVLLASGGRKPLVDPTGDLRPPLADATSKIADFGLAKQLGEPAPGTLTGLDTPSGAILGTPGYMAPEQMSGRPEDSGPAVDVYALGAVLYECLVGHAPFRAATLLETLEQVRTLEPVPPRRLQPSVPRDLETVCLRCLHKVPSRRLASARELADDLGRFLDGKPVRARRTSWGERLVRWTWRRPALAALAVVTVLALAGLAIGAWIYERRLSQALDRATANGARADANYRSARGAIEQMLSRLENRGAAEVSRVRELRRQQQEDAVAFFLAIADRGGDLPEVRADAARACREAGRLQIQLGKKDAARVSLERAHQLFAALADEFPSVGEYRLGLAATYDALWRCDPGSYADALHWLTEALALREALVREDPTSLEYRIALAASYHQLGHSSYEEKRPAEAERWWLRAVPLKEAILRQQPEARDQRLQLALTQINLSVLYQSQPAKQAEAERYHDQAEAHLAKLVELDPRDEEALARLAVLRVNWAYMLAGRGQADKAIDDLGKSITALTEALRLEPDLVQARDALFRSHGVRAVIREGQGRWAEAVEDRRRVVALTSKEDAAYQRLYLAMTLARAGDHQAAMAEVEALAAMPTHAVFAHLLHLATVASWATRAAQSDERLSPADRASRAERHAVRAVELLARARKAAGNDWHSAAPPLRKSEDFRPLWERADFRRLVGD